VSLTTITCIHLTYNSSLQINLGPLQPGMDGMTKMPTPFTPNPRCARRDLTTFASTSWLTFTNLHNITLGPASHSIAYFQDELQGRPQDGILGLHGAGHYAINGDGGDFYSSPNDPAFYLHHAMLDQVWWIWQALYPEKAKDVAGTVTYNNKPPSRNATTEDWIESNYLGVENVRMGDVLDTMGGSPLCYVYV
jgi:tyrosinase